jgi:hypothetical protein
MQGPANESIEHCDLLVNVPVGGHLTRHRSQTDQVGATSNDPLAGENAFEHLYVPAFAGAKLNGPSQEMSRRPPG